MRFLPQQTPGSLVLITLQSDADDGAGSTTYLHLHPRLHLIMQVGQAALRVHLKLFLQGPTRDQEPKKEAGTREGSRDRKELKNQVNHLRAKFNNRIKPKKKKKSKSTKAKFVILHHETVSEDGLSKLQFILT